MFGRTVNDIAKEKIFSDNVEKIQCISETVCKSINFNSCISKHVLFQSLGNLHNCALVHFYLKFATVTTFKVNFKYDFNY